MPVRPKHCKICDELGHTAFYCKYKKRTPLRSYKQLKAAGKYDRRWRYARQLWYATHPPDYRGYYYCYICNRALMRYQKDVEIPAGIMLCTLDHIEARTRDPARRFDQDNLAPCCAICNKAKGSLSLIQYKRKREEKLRKNRA